MSALDEKIGAFCGQFTLSPQQTRIFTAMMHGALSNEALSRELRMPPGRLGVHLQRIARKTMTVSRTELLHLFYEGRRGR
jgi:DNA-binding CsgD family transcriptional regulator